MITLWRGILYLTRYELLIAMGIAYSWMPTMLDIYATDKKHLKQLLPLVKYLRSIKNLYDFDKNAKKIEECLVKITPVINNSIVGTSKVLHIFSPQNIPIIDRNVLKGWNITFKKYYKKYPDLRLPMNIPVTTSRQVSAFMKYWRLLFLFKVNTKTKSIRQLEEPFYWIGMK